MNRFPEPKQPRRALPQHGEGCALVEPLTGAAADFVRNGGTHCPLCSAEVELGEMETEGRNITIAASCSCGFKAKAVYRLIDADL